MDNFRDNPSDAERERKWSEQDLRRFRQQFLFGAGGFALNGLILVGLFTGLIPEFGVWTQLSIAWLVLSLPVLTVFLLCGLSKGRDHRPSVMQMFAAAGRGR